MSNQQQVIVVREFQCYRFYKEPNFANDVLEFLIEEAETELHRHEIELYCVTPGEPWRQGRETDEACIAVATDRNCEAGFYIVHMFDAAYYIYHNRNDAEEALQTAKRIWQKYLFEWESDHDPTPQCLKNVEERIKIDHVLPGVPWSEWEDGAALYGHEALSPPPSSHAPEPMKD